MSRFSGGTRAGASPLWAWSLHPAGSAVGALPEHPPLRSVQDFQWPEATLVVHLGVFLQPVAQVDVIEVFAFRQLQQLENGEGAKTARFRGRRIEGVDRREPVAQPVEYRHADELVAFAHLQVASLAPGREQEVRVLRRALGVHLAFRMPPLLVVVVQRQQRGVTPGALHGNMQVAVAAQVAALAAVGTEAMHVDARRAAGAAGVAFRPVDVAATTAEAKVREPGLHFQVGQGARVAEHRAGAAVVVIAAGMFGGEVKRQADTARGVHGAASAAGSNRCSSPGSVANSQRPGSSAPVFAASSCRNSWRGISRLPRLVRCAEATWQSSRAKPRASSSRISSVMAALEASLTRLNMDSPKNTRPSATP